MRDGAPGVLSTITAILQRFFNRRMFLWCQTNSIVCNVGCLGQRHATAFLLFDDLATRAVVFPTGVYRNLICLSIRFSDANAERSWSIIACGVADSDTDKLFSQGRC
ncbi:MAG: hypothetical protein AAGC96_05915 [Pseudomonadota bacterium]